jgi:beta-glucanase (GH16 family)
MNRFALALLLLVPVSQLRADDWKLVWSDEFDKPGLPDPSKWIYEEGFVRNHEKQYYTRDRLQNARVENGCLLIEGRPEKFQNARYTSASLTTQGKASWRYGRVEVRAKLPHGAGVWPAIWMLGTNVPEVDWPACGEIDIVEFLGKDPGRLHATVHWRADGKHQSSAQQLATDRPFDDFHIYALEWFADHMDFYFDKIKYHTFALARAGAPADNPFTKPQFLLLNLALGGSWGGQIDNAILPQKFQIDYVRVYERTGPNR